MRRRPVERVLEDTYEDLIRESAPIYSGPMSEPAERDFLLMIVLAKHYALSQTKLRAWLKARRRTIVLRLRIRMALADLWYAMREDLADVWYAILFGSKR